MALNNFVGGRWVASESTETVPVHNPSTGEVIAETPLSTATDVDAAVAAARAAFPSWKKRPRRSGRQSCFATASDWKKSLKNWRS